VRFDFGDFALDTDRRELTRGVELIPIGPKVFDLLVYLVENRDRVVSKDELLGAVWYGRIVSESTLTSHINAVRKAVGDTGATRNLVRTLARKGFRFVGEVTTRRPPAEAKLSMPVAEIAGDGDVPPTIPDRPSIAVLPFANMSSDPEQEYFADGIVEDIITALGRFSWFFVIARNSTFAYKGTSADVRRIARELGVQYVLEGSVRKAASRVRINVQLTDALSGWQVWSERYEREFDDVFAVQDDISEAITSTIAPEFLSAERKRAERKAPENLDAWGYAIRGNRNLWTSDKDRLAEAKRLYLKAIELDDMCVLALCGLALVYNHEVLRGLTEDNERTLSLAYEAAHRAVMIDEQDAMAHAAMGWVFHVTRRPAEAVSSLRRALKLNPNLAFAEGTLGLVLSHQGKYEEAIGHAERAVRLSPYDPDSGTWMMARVLAPLVTERYDEYLEWAKRFTETYPTFAGGWRHLASAYAHIGKMEEARAALEKVLELIPGDTVRRERGLNPGIDVYGDRLIEGLRKAGLPE